MKKRMNLILLAAIFSVLVLLSVVSAATTTVVKDFIDYGVQSVTSTSAVIAVGYKTEVVTVGPTMPFVDYVFILKYWEEGSNEIHSFPYDFVMSLPERLEKTITGLKPGTKYYYQFYDEPVNSFTTLKSSESNYTVDFDLKNYSGCSIVNITINNLGDTIIKDWKLKWTFNGSGKIGQLWCANYTQAGQGVEVTPMPWNAEIAPKTSITFGFCSSGQITKPLDITLSMANPITIVNEPAATDITALVNANSKFAFDIFKQINATETGNNVFVSPLSISTALAMLYQGANGDTADEIAKVLSFQGIDIRELNSGYKSLLNNLQTIDPFVTLGMGNSVWYKEGYNVKPEFLATNNDVFKAEVKGLDFNKNDAAATINNWISNATNGMIEQMVNPPLAGEMYLINAIYFKGAWTEPFDPENTAKVTFKTELGNNNTVDMMHADMNVEFGKGTDYSAIRLPFGEKKVSMYCILPAEGLSIGNFVSGLSVEKFNEIKKSLSKKYNFSISLPKFKMTYGAKSLETVLNALGMNKAFDTVQADFSGITKEQAYVDDVLHKAVIDVNENGTKAAATTTVAIATPSVISVIPEYFRADRPFVFFIVDDTKGSILFMGKAADLVKY